VSCYRDVWRAVYVQQRCREACRMKLAQAASISACLGWMHESTPSPHICGCAGSSMTGQMSSQRDHSCLPHRNQSRGRRRDLVYTMTCVAASMLYALHLQAVTFSACYNLDAPGKSSCTGTWLTCRLCMCLQQGAGYVNSAYHRSGSHRLQSLPGTHSRGRHTIKVA
jgi:hypothetical protein